MADMAPHPSACRSVCDSYLSHVRITGKLSEEALAERERTCARFCAFIGDTPLEKLTPGDLVRWVGSQPWAANTRRHKCQQVQSVFAWHSRMSLTANPFAGASSEFGEGERREATRDDDYQAVLRISDVLFRQFLTFLRHQGCRPKEARELHWTDVDLAIGLWVLERHKTRKHTGKPRYVALGKVALQLLRVMRRRCDGVAGPVFLNRKGSAWSRPSLVQKWQRLRRTAKISQKSTLHGLRHAQGSVAVANGADTKLVSMGLGHSSVVTTEKFYLHLSREFEAIRTAMEMGKPRPKRRG